MWIIFTAAYRRLIFTVLACTINAERARSHPSLHGKGVHLSQPLRLCPDQRPQSPAQQRRRFFHSCSDSFRENKRACLCDTLSARPRTARTVLSSGSHQTRSRQSIKADLHLTCFFIPISLRCRSARSRYSPQPQQNQKSSSL